jgi:hypothetical protein
MVLTQQQTTAFFEGPDQMGIPHETVIQMADEGIDQVSDLADFDDMKQVAENLRHPPGRIQDPNNPNRTIPTPSFRFGARSKLRLEAAAKLVKFCNAIGRDLTAQNIRWNPIIDDFIQQWTALERRGKEELKEVPKISKALPILKWTEAMSDHFNRVVGVRKIPLTCVIREDVNIPAVCPPLATNKPHSELHGSVEQDLVMRASHNHPLFPEDNSKVYYQIEEATRGTKYVSTIKPFQRRKDGRGAWKSIALQHAGIDKWEKQLKDNDEFLHNRKWRSNGAFPLEHFVAQHRTAFTVLSQCKEYIPTFQLPLENTRVNYFLDAIETSDSELLASIALVRADKGPAGKMNNFEDATAHVIPADPVSKRKTNRKRPVAEIANVEADGNEKGSPFTKKKAAKGKTGVEFRYYKSKEYEKLSDAQIKELDQWRKANKKGKHADSKQTNQFDERQISSIVAKEFKACLADISGVETEKSAADDKPSQTNGTFKIVRIDAAEAVTPAVSNNAQLVSSEQPIRRCPMVPKKPDANKETGFQSVLRKIRK